VHAPGPIAREAGAKKGTCHAGQRISASGLRPSPAAAFAAVARHVPRPYWQARRKPIRDRVETDGGMSPSRRSSLGSEAGVRHGSLPRRHRAGGSHAVRSTRPEMPPAAGPMDGWIVERVTGGRQVPLPGTTFYL
jgi:hypothetical protein